MRNEDSQITRAISRDPHMYPDPDNFIPERFLKDGMLNTEVFDPRLYVFGHGRRRVDAWAILTIFIY